MHKIKRDQRGVAHLLLIVGVVAVVAVIGFVGYTVSKKNTDSQKSSSVSAVVADKQLEDSCNSELHDKDLCKFASYYQLDKISYKANISSTTSDGTFVTNMEVDTKGNSKMVSLQNGKEQSAFVTLNGSSYIKNEDDGSWTHYGGSNNSTPKEEKPTDDIKINTKDLKGENNTISYKSLGKESCGKLKCFKYQMVDTSQPDVQQFLWFDTKDYMLQRWSSKDSSGSMDMTLTYQSVTISAPSPSHDFSANSSADLQAAQAEAAAAAASNSPSDE